MRRSNLLAVVVGVVACVAGIVEGADTGKEQEPLRTVAVGVARVLKDAGIDAKVTLDAKGLNVTHRTRVYQVHSTGKTGEASEKAHKEVGPSYMGIILSASVRDGARSMSQVAGVTLQGQEHDPDPLCPYCEATYGLPPTEACSLAPQAIEVRMSPWVFLKLTCWTGDGDISGASLFIPVSLATYRGDTAK